MATIVYTAATIGVLKYDASINSPTRLIRSGIGTSKMLNVGIQFIKLKMTIIYTGLLLTWAISLFISNILINLQLRAL